MIKTVFAFSLFAIVGFAAPVLASAPSKKKSCQKDADCVLYVDECSQMSSVWTAQLDKDAIARTFDNSVGEKRHLPVWPHCTKHFFVAVTWLKNPEAHCVKRVCKIAEAKAKVGTISYFGPKIPMERPTEESSVPSQLIPTPKAAEKLAQSQFVPVRKAACPERGTEAAWLNNLGGCLEPFRAKERRVPDEIKDSMKICKCVSGEIVYGLSCEKLDQLDHGSPAQVQEITASIVKKCALAN